MKKIFYLILVVLLVVYLGGYIYFSATKNPINPVCESVIVTISDSLEINFLTEKRVVEYLAKTNLYPLHKKWEEINTYQIEAALLKNEMVETAEVVQLTSGQIIMTLTQKKPVLRVFSSNGNYYVDRLGQTMTTTIGHGIQVPVASGNIEKSFAVSELYKFALFLQGDAFWNDQITQIYVRSKSDVEIIPRVGNHQILLGSLDDYEKKLQHLRLFYEQVIPKMGWDKYSVINLKYRNQIVCTKK